MLIYFGINKITFYIHYHIRFIVTTYICMESMELVILFTHLFIFALSIIFSSVNYQNMIEHTLINTFYFW